MMKFNETLKPINGELIIEWDEAAKAYRVKYSADNVSGNYFNHVASFEKLRVGITDKAGKTKQLTLT